MIKWASILTILLFSCGPQEEAATDTSPVTEAENVVELADESLVASVDSNASFFALYKKMTAAIEAKDYDQLNSCIYKNHGVYIVETAGAVPLIHKKYDVNDFLSFQQQQKLLDLDFDGIAEKPVFDALPQIICGDDIYDKKGCFVEEINLLKDSQIWNFYSVNEKEIQEIEAIIQTINYTVRNTANYTFYFSKIGGEWYLTFIDLRIPCSA